jgi:hypothetical protein
MMKLAPRHRERLERLADLLENLDDPKVRARLGIRDPKKKRVQRFKNVAFNMGYWFEPDNSCDTSACAAGIATLDPWFQKQGLHLKDNTPKFSRYPDGIASLSRFFFGKDPEWPNLHLASADANPASYLFSPRWYHHLDWHDIKPRDVAKRVREVLASAD